MLKKIRQHLPYTRDYPNPQTYKYWQYPQPIDPIYTNIVYNLTSIQITSALITR
jgi:hypothetical protein